MNIRHGLIALGVYLGMMAFFALALLIVEWLKRQEPWVSVSLMLALAACVFFLVGAFVV